MEAADKLLPMLEQQCAGPADNYKYVKNCKKLVRQIMDAGANDEDAAYISRRFAEQLCKSDEFRTYDYYLLWLGNRLLIQYPADNAKLIDALRKKVNNRDQFKAPAEVRQELCVFAIETILEMVAYPEKSPLGTEMRIDWPGWNSLATWIEKNRDQFVFDKATKRFQPKKP